MWFCDVSLPYVLYFVFLHPDFSPITSHMKSFRLMPLVWFLLVEIWYICKLMVKDPSMWWLKSFFAKHHRHIKWSKYMIYEGVKFHCIDFKEIAWMITYNVSCWEFMLWFLDLMTILIWSWRFARKKKIKMKEDYTLELSFD